MQKPAQAGFLLCDRAIDKFFGKRRIRKNVSEMAFGSFPICHPFYWRI